MGLRGGGGGVKNKVWIGIQVYKAYTVGVLFRDCEFCGALSQPYRVLFRDRFSYSHPA